MQKLITSTPAPQHPNRYHALKNPQGRQPAPASLSRAEALRRMREDHDRAKTRQLDPQRHHHGQQQG